jgi:hypothetical protein
MKAFTDQDVIERTPGLPTIYADRADLIDDPLPWQQQGLQQTASGYGRRLTMRSKIMFNGRPYRLYCACFSNVGSVWFTSKGRSIFVD